MEFKRTVVNIYSILPTPISSMILDVLQHSPVMKKDLEGIIGSKLNNQIKKKYLKKLVHDLLKFMKLIGYKVVNESGLISVSNSKMNLTTGKLDIQLLKNESLSIVSDLHSPMTSMNVLEEIVRGSNFVVTAGDVTSTGRRSEWECIKKYFDYTILGNHDIVFNLKNEKGVPYNSNKVFGKMIGLVLINNIPFILLHDYMKLALRYPTYVNVQYMLNEDRVLVIGHPHYGFLTIRDKELPYWKNMYNVLIIPLGALTIHGSYKNMSIDFLKITGKGRGKIKVMKIYKIPNIGERKINI